MPPYLGWQMMRICNRCFRLTRLKKRKLFFMKSRVHPQGTFRIVLIPIFLMLLGCSTSYMAVDDARKVALTVQKKPFIAPPPKSIFDLLDAIEKSDYQDPEIKEWEDKANELPPEVATHEELIRFYNRRGNAAYELGRNGQALNDLRKCYALLEQRKFPFSNIKIGALIHLEIYDGKYQRALELVNKHLRYTLQGAWRSVLAYACMGDFENAEKTIKAVKWGNWSNSYGTQANLGIVDLLYYQMTGRFSEAEKIFRRDINRMPYYLDSSTIVRSAQFRYKVAIARCLIMQKKYSEAEVLLRSSLRESLQLLGIRSGITADHLSTIGNLFLEKGRIEDAKRIGWASLKIWEDSGVSSDSLGASDSRLMLARAFMAENDFAQAEHQIAQFNEESGANPYVYGRFINFNPDPLLIAILNGRPDEAINTIDQKVVQIKNQLGIRNFQLAEIMAYRAMAFFRKKEMEKAFNDFHESIPVLIHYDYHQLLFSTKKRLIIILEDYLDFLDELRNASLEKRFGIDAVDEGFMIADTLRSIKMYQVSNINFARWAAQERETSDLIREKEDLENQLDAMYSALINAQHLDEGPDKKRITQNLKDTIIRLDRAASAINAEVEKRFPKVRDYFNPKPARLDEAQKALRPGEALISVYPARNKIHTWAVPYQGDAQYASSQIKKKNLTGLVANLRQSFVVEGALTFGDIRPFDVGDAYFLFRHILEPVGKGWKAAENLHIIAADPLNQIPFSIMPTESVRIGAEKEGLFSNYRSVPWIIRKYSITNQASATSFMLQRKLAKKEENRRAFLGFGDPIFNVVQVKQQERTIDQNENSPSSLNEPLKARGVRLTNRGSLDNKEIRSASLEHLNRLPETAEEIRQIAAVLEADEKQDIYLAEKASEHNVKTAGLKDRKVIVFASHALLPGDLDGLDQAAIALSSPSVVGGEDDGLLTLEEISRLQLNADCVVLSACTTGTSDETGAEAINGLGQVFLYAGTKSVFVSLWPVETTSAKQLTTGFFQNRKKYKDHPMGKALQESMLNIIDHQALRDKESGKVISSYAHPLFWAPFILVGDWG